MKVAVTGAAGFIGQHVVAEIRKYSAEIEIVAISRGDVSQRIKGVSFINLDLSEANAKTFEKLGKPDLLIHLAWGGLSDFNTRKHFEQELPLHYHFLQQLVNSGLKSVFVAGTCFEYGLYSGSLGEDLKTSANTCYGFAKDVLRCQLEFLQKKVEFSLIWGRLFYLYGQGQVKNALQPQLLKAIQKGDKFFNMSGGEQLRDYLNVEVAVKYIVTLALHENDIGIINICSGTPISIRKQVENWIDEQQASIQLNLGYYPYPDYESMAFWGDKTKLNFYLKKQDLD